LPSRSKISMLKMLLGTVDLKELRNTQDFLDKRTTNNQTAHSMLASPWALLHQFFNTPKKQRRRSNPDQRAAQPRIPAAIQKKGSQPQRCDPQETHGTQVPAHTTRHTC
jgi:hypothetical protein